MKLNNFFKKQKINKEFDPSCHWYLILISIVILLILIIFYSIYNFIYIKNQIEKIETESRNDIKNSTSTEDIQKNQDKNRLLNNINNINKKIDEYEKKEIEYNKILNNYTETVATSTE